MAEEIANAFVNHYFATLDSNPAGLAGLYQAQSTSSVENAVATGPEAIVAKWASLGALQHDIAGLKRSVQVSVQPNAMLILVAGQMSISGNQPILFSQVFQLVASAPGQYYIHNELFCFNMV